MPNVLDVFVTDVYGSPLPRLLVGIFFDAVTKGPVLEEFTDHDGHATFHVSDVYVGTDRVTISVAGGVYGPYPMAERSWTVQLG